MLLSKEEVLSCVFVFSLPAGARSGWEQAISRVCLRVRELLNRAVGEGYPEQPGICKSVVLLDALVMTEE